MPDIDLSSTSLANDTGVWYSQSDQESNNFWFLVFIDEGGFTFKFSTFNPALCK